MAKINEEYLRSSIFGFEDALVSTTGVVVGISAGTHSEKIIILACLVTIAVEALSMGAGQFLTEETVHEIEGKKHYADSPLIGALIMFASYFLAGLVPVIPTLILPFPTAIAGSLIAAFIGLFILGYFKGKIVKIDPFKSALRMLMIGGITALTGTVVGYIFKI